MNHKILGSLHQSLLSFPWKKSIKLPGTNPEDIQKLLTERQVDVTLPWYEDMSPLPLSVTRLHFSA